MTNNHYIDKVRWDEHIFDTPENLYQHVWKWREYFQNDAEIFLEIGTWLGNFFSVEASEQADKNFIGMEIRYKRLFKTAEKSRNLWVKNFILLKDFGQNIDKIFAPWEVQKVYIFFPDPWEKKDRQKKHKLLQKEFLEKLFHIVSLWGKVCFKTDHRGYFDEVLELVKEQKKFQIHSVSYDYEKETTLFKKEKLTEFEAMYRGEKCAICYAEFIK